MRLKGVLFDLDDTLFDFAAAERAGLLGQLRDQGLLDAFPDTAAALALWREIMDAVFARYVAGEITIDGQRRERVKRFLDRSDMSDEQASAWFAGYAAYRNAAWAAFPDAEPVLARIAPRYRLGIVSNASAEQQRTKLHVTGLLPYFGDAIVCADLHGASKPDPGIFLAGCAALGLEPSEVAYVGDNYAIDAVGARDAGLRAYWIDRTRARQDAQVAQGIPDNGITVIHSLDELPAALA